MVAFVLTAGTVNTKVVLVCIDFRNHIFSFLIRILVLLLVIYRYRIMPRILSRVVDWAKAHHSYSLEFKERGVSLWAFMRTWEKHTFRRVAVAVTDRFVADATHEL